MSLGPRTKVLALVQNAERKAAGQAFSLPQFSHLVYLPCMQQACEVSSTQKPPPMNFPGATAFLLLFPFPTGVCFYCMPRCLSFQKTNGHDEQQKQRPEALGRGGCRGGGRLAGRNATEMDFCYYYCRWSRLLNFIALQ